MLILLIYRLGRGSMKKHILLNILYIVFLVLVILSFVFMVLGMGARDVDYSFDDKSLSTFNDGWGVSEGIEEDRDSVVMNLPIDLDSDYKEIVTISKHLPKELGNYNCLMLESKRQDIKVYIDGRLRKSYTEQGQRISNSLPYSYVMIPLHDSDAGKRVRITVKTDTYYSGNIGEIFIGNEMSILLMLIKSNVIWLALVFGTILIGAICLICFLVYRKTFALSHQFLYLFWFAIFSGFWCFSQLKIRQVFLKDIPLFESGGHCCFLLIPIPIVLIVNVATGLKYTRFYQSVLVCLMINFLVQNVLHTGFAYDYFLMQNVTQIIMLVLLIVSIVLCTRVMTTNGRSGVLDTSIIGTVFYTLGILAEAIAMSMGAQYTVGSYFIGGTYIFATANLFGTFISNNEEQQKKKDAEIANQAKSRFLATMSHEIRTPINVILGMNEMILRDSGENTILDYASNISEAGKSLLALINDILDVSKIESGKMDIVPVDYQMKVLLNDSIMMAKGRIGKKDIKLVLDIDETIPAKYFGDEVRIKQVVTNLLTNAAKYTEQGTITFSVKNKGISNDQISLYFSVKDTGIGIKESDIETLLTSSFVRVDEARNRNIEGTGLGLSITRQLLELMGSKLEVESKYGEGSNFFFTIEQKIVDNAPMGAVDVHARSTGRKARNTFTAPFASILVVDDTKPNLLVIKGLLKPYEMNVETASSGMECLEKCQKNEYDLIFMDHMMPGMDGIETLKKLRNGSSANHNTKVIVLTANAIAGAGNMYKDCGFDGYLTKPIDVNELDSCMKEHLPENKINS